MRKFCTIMSVNSPFIENIQTQIHIYRTKQFLCISTFIFQFPDECDEDDLACNPVYLLLGVIVLVLVLYFILMMTRIFLCFVYRRCVTSFQNKISGLDGNKIMPKLREQTERLKKSVIRLAIWQVVLKITRKLETVERGFDNSAFIDPPPTYEQLFKPDEPPPVYETPNVQRRALPTQNEQ